MTYRSINPANRQLIKSYDTISDNTLYKKLESGHRSFLEWERLTLTQRISKIRDVANVMKAGLEKHALCITQEMGKPIRESRMEVEKCIRLCNYYADNSVDLLKDEYLESDASKSYLSFEPMGIIYAVMPWNFPYWQVFRFLVPNLILGNAGLLKHASNVPQCAEAIEGIVLKAGIDEGVFQNLFIDYRQSELVIKNENVRGVTLTGSNHAGSKVAETAGKYIKKSVMELGGSDPFIVLEDADLEKAATTGCLSRMRNAGQSCIAAKRFIVVDKVYDDFLEIFRSTVSSLKIGDPMSEDTDLGPVAAEYLLEELEQQVNVSVQKGAEVILGGKLVEENTLFYEPTVLVNVKPGMPAFNEEIFGPVATVFKVSSVEEAIDLANNTIFGLGGAIFSKDTEGAARLAKKIRTGTVAINGIVKSEPCLPFGGTRDSGYGRELSELGIKEFANIKTINVFNA